MAVIKDIINQVLDEFSPIGLFAIDESFTINYVNQGTKNLLGDRPLVGASSLDLVHPDDMAIIARTISDFHTGTRIGVPTLIRMLHQSGSYVPIECWVQKSFTDGPVRFVMAMRDATPENCLDRFLEGVQQQDPLDDVLGWLVRSLDSRAGASTHAIVWDWDGEKFLCGVSNATDVTSMLAHSLFASGKQNKADQLKGALRGKWHNVAFGETYVPLFVADGSPATHISMFIPAAMVDETDGSLCCVVSLSQHGIPVGAGAEMACERIAHFAQLAIEHNHRAARVLHDSLTDPLTNLINRRALCLRLEDWLRNETPGAVVLIDLDGFKAVNDAFGHAGGDDLLIQCARRLTEAVSPGDFVGRLGGDEFAVLIHGEADVVALGVERLNRAFEAPMALAGLMFPLGASLGVAQLQCGVDDLESALRGADEQMYETKRRRKFELSVPVLTN